MEAAARRVACITGGTSGIGRALSLRYLDEGWKVLAIGKGETHALELEKTASGSGELTVHVADLTEFAKCSVIAKEIEQTDARLDLLVNAAGTIGSGGVQEETPARFEDVIKGNLWSAFNMTKASVELLTKTSNACVINISSVCSLRPCASVAYSVAKAGMDMFTKTIARELAANGIRVNSVNPSVVKSNLQKSAGLFDDDVMYEKWVNDMTRTHPLGRVGLPEDIVEAVYFLASEKATWITGSIFSVDGGRSVA
jgi:NAD(P)-dependent dehydrogenase (short-subunit alcohol dehydrogenase family)